MRGGVVVLVFSKKKGELWQHKKIRVVGIDPFNSAHALLHILGR